MPLHENKKEYVKQNNDLNVVIRQYVNLRRTKATIKALFGNWKTLGKMKTRRKKEKYEGRSNVVFGSHEKMTAKEEGKVKRGSHISKFG